MWAPSVNNSGHSPLSTAQPKWVPYLRANNILEDTPPEGTPSNVMVNNSNKMSAHEEGPNNSDCINQPVVRRIASAPLQYQECITREHSSHLHSSKPSAKRRPETNSAKNQTPPRIKASVSTISWREELTHVKSAYVQAPPKSRPASKANNHTNEENHISKNSAKVSTETNGKQVSKSRALGAFSSVDVNGRKEQKGASSIDAMASSSKTSINGPHNSNIANVLPQSKTELNSQNKDAEDGHFSHLMDSISAIRKLANVTRSHMDVTGSKDNIIQTKKRSSSENNLAPQKNEEKHMLSSGRASSLTGKTRYEGIKTHPAKRTSPKKADPALFKKSIEASDPVKEKKKGYDQEKAREYIKQQRCERLSSIREEKQRKKVTEEAKKQKLLELDQKRHQLLQANIKKKPHHAADEKIASPPKTEDLKAPSTILVPKLNSAPSGSSHPRPVTASTAESGLYVFPGPSHPVVADSKHSAPLARSESSIIIKDINDMKAKIELLANSIKSALHSGQSESSKEKKKATVVDLQDGVELRIGENIQEDVKIQPKPLSLEKPLLIHENFDAAEVNHLTNNLRKMRENFRCVLAQNLNVWAKPRSESKLKSVDTERTDPANTEKYRLLQWINDVTLQPPVPDVLQKKTASGSSSEIDKTGGGDLRRRPRRRRTKSSILHSSYQRARSLPRRRETSDDSDQENLSGKPVHRLQSPSKSELGGVNIPEWLKSHTQSPYPVNVMSVVKRKIAAKKTVLETPTITLNFSTPTTNTAQSQPIVSHNFSSSNHQNPLFIPPMASQDVLFGNGFASDQRNAKNGSHDLPTDGLFPASHMFDLFLPDRKPTKPNLVEKSQQTTPKDSLAISPEGFHDESEKLHTADNSSWSGRIINTSVPPLPRLSSTTTEISSRVSPELLSSGTSTRVSQVSQVSVLEEVKPTSFLEDEKEPTYESDFERAPMEARKSGEDTDAPSISSTIGENRLVDSESIRLITPNVDLFSNKTEKSDWSSRRDCGDGENASQTSTNQGKESFEIGRLFNPEAIHLQFQAELNRLDAVNESLFHVMEVEKVRAVALAREQALLSTKRENVQTTSEQPSSKSDKAISVQKSLPASSADVSTVNYTRGSGTHSSGEISTVNYTRGSDNSPSLLKVQDNVEVAKESSIESIKTEIGGNDISTESPNSPVCTSQPSSILEKSPSPQSSDATVSEDIKSQKSPTKEKGQLKRLKLRQTDKMSSETLSRGSKVVSVEDESTEPSVVGHGPDIIRTGDAVAVSKNERVDRRPGTPAKSEGAFQFTLQMLEQLMYEEELRVQHKRTLLKLRERVLCDMAKAECASLDLDKKKLRDIGGQEEQISALRKKQRGVLMKFQQQRDEINSMQRTDELVWRERRLMYLRQLHLFRMQMSTRSHKTRRDEDGTVMPKSVISRGIASRRDFDLETTPDFNALLGTASLSSPSAASDISIPSIPLPANTSGDTESSCVDERPLQSIKDTELRSRNSRDRDPSDPLRQPVEQLNLWRRRLEDEERRLRDVERQGHSRHRALHIKHCLRDRSTSPFQFSEIATTFGRSSGNSKQRSRPVSNESASGNVEDDSSVPEDIADQQESNMSSVKEALSAAAVSEGYTESFESIDSDAKTADTQSGTGEIPTQSNGPKETSVKGTSSSLSDRSSVTQQPLLHEKSKEHPSVTIKIPLSPRLQRVQRRRYSSGSDDSIVFSQTETGSEQSDIEGRISALTEQLEQRKAEAERLRREAKRTRCERLLAKEQSLQKQLQAYDVYISQARQNLDAELKQTSVPIVRPQIKQPRVASSGKAKNSNTSQQSEQDVSIQDSVAESSASQDSSLDAATLSPSKQNGGELEFVLPEHSSPKDAISDAMSTAPSEAASGDISEVSSENGSTVSNENASLVANMGGKNEMAVKKAVAEVGSDTLSSAGSDVASEVATDVLSEMESSACTEIIEDVLNKQDDATKGEVADVLKHTEEPNEVSAAPSPVSSDSMPLEKVDASDSGDAEDLIPGVIDANVIKVVLKKKEKLEIRSELSVEDPVQPLNKEQQAALLDKITDSILQTLLNDCVQNANKPDDSVKTVIQTQVEEEFLPQNPRVEKSSQQTGKKSKDVRTRVHEILAETIQSPSSRTETRIQDLMVTTYDILSPDDTPCSSPHQGSPTRQTYDSPVKSTEYSDTRTQTQTKSAEGLAEMPVREYNGSSDPASIFNDSVQDWSNEECSGASEQEAELLRLQELRIEQRIQQLDQQIDQIPYFLREIPNKPPPPYTPPGQAPRVLATSVPCSPPLEEIRAVTKSQSEIVQAVAVATDILFEAYCLNHIESVKSVTPPESFLAEGYSVPEHVKLCEQDLEIHKHSARVFRRFLFDLTRQLVEEAYSHEEKEHCPPWHQPENVFIKRKALAEAPRSREKLQQIVTRQALALFGFGPKAEKENLMIRWSRKKRDHVDELLVRELQEEDRQWTSYEYDEAAVKNNVTESILEALLIDTTEVVKEIFQRRQRRHIRDHDE